MADKEKKDGTVVIYKKDVLEGIDTCTEIINTYYNNRVPGASYKGPIICVRRILRSLIIGADKVKVK